MKLIKKLVLVATMFCLASCNHSNNSASSNSDVSSSEEAASYFVDPDTSHTHYLDFINSGEQVAQMAVFPDDTYEGLEPYFPVLPAEEITGGKTYTLYWELAQSFVTTKDGVTTYTIYSQTQLEINVYAQRMLKK
jgi:hypothetical protein